MFARTVTMGSTSAGNSTLRIRFPPAMSEPADSFSDATNQVHGRIPQNMKSGYGVGRSFPTGRNTVKMIE